jgi:hypothetical protein
MTADLDPAALQRLLDRQAIEDCVLRYTRGVDRGDEGLIRSAYHPDASENHAGYEAELERIVPFLFKVHARYSGYQHYVTDIAVEIDGDTADADSYWFCVLRQDDRGELMLSGGRYADRMERRDGEWRIVRREVSIIWQSTVPGGPATAA